MDPIPIPIPPSSDPTYTMNFPEDFRCPISLELMKDPVTISTGVTYERKNIEKWYFTYKKLTCPATMQSVDDFGLTPNHTLKRLILAWQNVQPCPSPARASPKHGELLSLLDTVESTPFKVSSLKKLRSFVETGEEDRDEFKSCGGVEVLVRIVVQISGESSDFAAFRACEEALGVLHLLLSYSYSEEDEREIFHSVSEPAEFMKAIAFMLQRGSAEARFYAISILEKIAKIRGHDYDWSFGLLKDQGMDLFKAMLELVSDQICTKATSCALRVLIEMLTSSKKSRLKAIEAGAICILIELLPDSSRSKCDKIMHLIKLLCECAEGRLAFIEHRLGIAAVAKKMLRVSDASTKFGVKILWLISNSHPSERVVEEMLMFGAAKKMVALLHIDDGRSSTKDKAVKILKSHGNTWKRYPCFPSELRDCLGF